MSITQPRHPQGAPSSVGGQFTTQTPPEAATVLNMMVDGQYGSLAFPDRSIAVDADAEELARRVWSLPVSETLLANAIHMHARWRQAALDQRVDAELTRRYAKGPPPGDLELARLSWWQSHPSGHETEAELELHLPMRREMYARHSADLQPERLRGSDSATVVRAGSLSNMASWLNDPVEAGRVAQLPVTIGGEVRSVGEVVEQYRTDFWLVATFRAGSSDLATRHAMEDLAAELRRRD